MRGWVVPVCPKSPFLAFPSGSTRDRSAGLWSLLFSRSVACAVGHNIWDVFLFDTQFPSVVFFSYLKQASYSRGVDLCPVQVHRVSCLTLARRIRNIPNRLEVRPSLDRRDSIRYSESCMAAPGLRLVAVRMGAGTVLEESAEDEQEHDEQDRSQSLALASLYGRVLAIPCRSRAICPEEEVHRHVLHERRQRFD